jgi:alginate O-acetyltransferase complex protein AlgI
LLAFRSEVERAPTLALNGAPVRLPVTLRADDLLSLTPHGPGARTRYLVEIELTGGIVLVTDGDAGVPFGGAQVDTARHANDQASRTTRLTLAAADTLPRLLISPLPTGATVSRVDVTKLRRTAAQPWNGSRATIAGLLLAAGTVLVWLTHASRSASQTVLIATAVAILGVSSPLFGVAVLALATFLYTVGKRTKRRMSLLWVGVAATVVSLLGWKYAYPLVDVVFGHGLGRLAIPIGLLFFLLRLIDAQLRWYRGEEVDVSFREYLAFVVFPATMIAGPLETLKGFREKRLARITSADVATGVGRMVLGLAKKLILGDFLLYRVLYGEHVALYDRAILSGQASAVVLMLTAAFLFAAIDLSAYADLAIGLGRLHGYVIHEDSNWPVLASSLRDFWRRWHMSVVEWCMSTVYVPLVIAARSPLVALFVSMTVMGVWHQATWSWLLWALHFTVGLTVANWLSRRAAGLAVARRFPVTLFTRVLVLAFVISAHAFTQADDVRVAVRLYRSFWTSPFHLFR